jgi:PAS domain S-box-containing protein
MPHAGSTPVTDQITDSVLAGIATISADAIICVDESQRIIFFNEGAVRIFGYAVEEAMGQRLEMLIPARFRGAHGKQVHNFGHSSIKARRMGERTEISGLRKNGEEFPAEAAISHLGEGDNKVYSVVLRDITVRRRLEQNQRFLAEAGEKLASSLGTEETIATVAKLAVPALADAAVVTTFHGGTFRGVSVAHVEPSRAKALQKIRESTPPDLQGSHPVMEALRSGKALVTREASASDEKMAAVLSQAGTIFEPSAVEAALVLPLIARTQLLGVLELYRERRIFDSDDVILAEDMSRRAALAIDNARLHEEVMVGLRARDDMIGIVSHDLRNPANAIKMLTGAILGAEREAELPEDVVEYSTVIRQAADQMDSLIRDLLDVTRVEAGRLGVEPIPTDVTELLNDAVPTLLPVAAAKSIALRLDIQESLPRVAADRERIRQALSNLIGNSVKFSPSNTVVDVSARRQGDEVVISVRDQGPGMTTEQLSHAFDRFWQSRRTDREGAGLGLAITHGIIDAHGGRIWAESAIGQGTTFSFSLRVVEPEPHF